MKKAFSLVELIIVVAILGILAAVVIPSFKDNVKEAKEAAAKDSLRILRNTIQNYAAQHDDIAPGYYSDTPVSGTLTFYFTKNLTKTETYLNKIPENPFNNLTNLKAVSTAASFPATADGTTGWVYKPATKEIRLNYPGTDSKGVRYYDY